MRGFMSWLLGGRRGERTTVDVDARVNIEHSITSPEEKEALLVEKEEVSRRLDALEEWAKSIRRNDASRNGT